MWVALQSQLDLPLLMKVGVAVSNPLNLLLFLVRYLLKSRSIMVNWSSVLPPLTVPTQPSDGNAHLLGICVTILITFLIPFSYFLFDDHSLVHFWHGLFTIHSLSPDSESFQTLTVVVSIVAIAALLIVIALVVNAYCLYQKRRYYDSMKGVVIKIYSTHSLCP